MKKIYLTILLGILSIASFAQTVKTIQGDLKALKDQASLNLEFVYDGMTIGEDALNESDYIAKKKGELDAKEKGRGDKWETSWKADRKDNFEPKFKQLFEKYGRKKVASDSKYTLVFTTTRTEPGWVGVGIIRKSARIDGEAVIVETKNRSNIIAKLTVTNALGAGGMGYDYDTGLRIQEAYAKSGKELGKVVAKN